MNVAEKANQIKAEIAKAFVGQDHTVEQMLAAVLADGHVLLEGVPGLGKTLLVRAVSFALDLPFSRIQFTPDLMPTDVVGTEVFDQRDVDFKLRRGPVFTSILLADEVNRTPPKTQSALLEAMEERHVTIGGERHELPFPFLVFATQNPIEFEGTYPLPEAQQDRFLMKIVLDYQEPNDEMAVLKRFHQGFRSQNLTEAGIRPVVNATGLAELRKSVNQTTVEDKVFDYIYSIVSATRNHPDLQVGGSPRAGLALLSCSKAVAALRGRDYVIPDDVKELALPVLRHRVLLKPEAEIEGMTVDQVLSALVGVQVVPR